MYLYQYSGDEERLLPHVESSKLMSEFIYYMKNGTNIILLKR